MDCKHQDRDKILAYLKNHLVCTVGDIILESGAERLRVYPILFELCQEKKIKVLKEAEWGAPVRVVII